jgi:murein DD-endopeptidase MepM/ murein hydrolase activator NlpD
MVQEINRKIFLSISTAFLILFAGLCASAQPGKGAVKVEEGLFLGFLWPLRGNANSPYGMRRDPISGDIVRHHSGIDIAAPGGAHVVASRAGRVTFADTRGGYGKLVILSHAGDMETRYGHLSSFKVKEGHFVRPGQALGTVGDTGRSTGNHLHFEIRVSGRADDPIKWLVPYGYMMPLKQPDTKPD